MSRELLLWALSLLLVGSLHVACGAWLGRAIGAASLWRLTSAQQAERQAWRAIWEPLAPGALVLAFLLGWALQEPETAEALQGWVYLLVAPIALVWLRAVHRAWRAGSARHVPVAGTVGLLRPRVVVGPALRAAVDEHAFAAALAHEEAHVRHRDPLRLLLAQLATDLQWPARAAQGRLAQWREVLELARDEEACEHGVSGPDLAAAVVAAARLQPGVGQEATAVASLTLGASEALRLRVTRLLGDAAVPLADREVEAQAGRAHRWRGLARSHLGTAFVIAAVGVATLGYCYGELVVSRLTGL